MRRRTCRKWAEGVLFSEQDEPAHAHGRRIFGRDPRAHRSYWMWRRRWSRRHAEPIAVPPGRSGWVQSNFLMRNCAMLSRPSTVEGSITLRYRVGGSLGSEVVSVAAAQMLLTRGPRHPSLPINQVG